ncbi:hypothetical protein PENTCL1PPCAC_9790, partial [Pristionchus entomophagus]
TDPRSGSSVGMSDPIDVNVFIVLLVGSIVAWLIALWRYAEAENKVATQSSVHSVDNTKEAENVMKVLCTECRGKSTSEDGTFHFPANTFESLGRLLDEILKKKQVEIDHLKTTCEEQKSAISKLQEIKAIGDEKEQYLLDIIQNQNEEMRLLLDTRQE